MALTWVSIGWGITWLPSKIGVQEMPALQMAGIRQLIAGILFLSFFFIRGTAVPKMRQMGKILLLSIIFLVVSNGLTLMSLKHIESGIGSLIGATTPLWIAIFQIIFLRRQPLNLFSGLGILLGFGGIVIVFYDHVADLFNPEYRDGIILSAAATFSWSLGTLMNAKKDDSINPFVSLAWQMLFSGIMLLIATFFTGEHIPLAAISAAAWWSIAFLVLVGSVITFVCYIYALKYLPTAQVSIYAYINPIIAMFLGAVILHERMNLYIILGALVTLIGVFLVNWGFRKK